MKKEINITGRIVFPLQEGARAIISCGGQFIYTSPVVEIRDEETDYVCFESMNSVYKVCRQSHPVEASVPSILKMCA